MEIVQGHFLNETTTTVCKMVMLSYPQCIAVKLLFFSFPQCIAGIACAELPTDEWPELISQLVNNVTAEAQNKTPEEYDDLKEASLEAIGYICQDIVSTF